MASRGKWVGQYSQGGRLHPFAIVITFQGNNIMGDGTDEIGPFTIGGTRTPSGEVNFMKQYHGAHCVNYKGHMCPDGTSIAGDYSVGLATGGFIMTMEK